MLNKKLTGNQGGMPPDLTGTSPAMGQVVGGEAANAGRYAPLPSHARRMRRQRRIESVGRKVTGGWSLRLW